MNNNNRRIKIDSIRSYPRIAISEFRASNSAIAMRYPDPYKYDDEFETILIEKDWSIMGWNEAKNLPWTQSELKQDMLVVMFESPDKDNVWFHFIHNDELIDARRS